MRVEFKTIDEFYHLVNRHAVTQDSGYEFGIIPILRIEFVRQSFYSGLKSSLIDELEVITLGALIVHSLDDLALANRFGTEYTVLIISKACENLVRTAVDKPYEGNPLFFVVLESHDISLKFHWAFEHKGLCNRVG